MKRAEIPRREFLKLSVAALLAPKLGAESRREAVSAGRDVKHQLVVGTGTSVGKNIVACALMKLSAREGWRVAPFKPLAVEVGVDQSSLEGIRYTPALDLQSLAANTAIDARMNPVLVSYETSHDTTPQFYLQGTLQESVGKLPLGARREMIAQTIQRSARSLAADFDFIVAEGSGGAADALGTDMVHEVAAETLDANVHLVTSFENGGGFAAALGTLLLMPEGIRRRVVLLVLNRFTGKSDDIEFLRFKEKIDTISPGIEVVIFPELRSIRILQEDMYLKRSLVEESNTALEMLADMFSVAVSTDVALGYWFAQATARR